MLTNARDFRWSPLGLLCGGNGKLDLDWVLLNLLGCSFLFLSIFLSRGLRIGSSTAVGFWITIGSSHVKVELLLCAWEILFVFPSLTMLVTVDLFRDFGVGMWAQSCLCCVCQWFDLKISVDMDYGRNRPSRAGPRLPGLSLRTGLGLAGEENWNKSVDESGNRRFSDSEDRPQKTSTKSGKHSEYNVRESFGFLCLYRFRTSPSLSNLTVEQDFSCVMWLSIALKISHLVFHMLEQMAQ